MLTTNNAGKGAAEMSLRMKRFTAAFFIFCILAALPFAAPQKASAETEIQKVLATTSYTPVALMDVGFISAATSTEGCYVTSITWYDQNYTALTDKFGTDTYHLEIRLDASEGYVFADGLSAYLNNSAVDYSRDDSGAYIVIRRDYTPAVWLPTVIKHPGAETVTEGGWASFVATATYASEYTWSLMDPSGRTIACSEIASKFPNVTVGGDGTDKIIVRNIPLEMDGWKAVCTFTGPGGSVTSNGALITVNPDPAKATPSPSPTPSSAPEETADPSPEPSPEQHTHEFSDKWQSDAGHHWRECECGEKTDRAEHTMSWTELRAATQERAGEERGECTVCGYVTSRELQYKGGDGQNAAGSGVDLGTFRIILFAVMGLIALGAVALIVRGAVGGRGRRR